MVSNHVYHTQQAPVGQHPVGNGRLDLTPVTVEVPLASVAPSGVRVPLDDCLLREMAQQPYRLERQKQLLLLDLARECNATETKKGKIADAARLLHTRSLREKIYKDLNGILRIMKAEESQSKQEHGKYLQYFPQPGIEHFVYSKTHTRLGPLPSQYWDYFYIRFVQADGSKSQEYFLDMPDVFEFSISDAETRFNLPVPFLLSFRNIKMIGFKHDPTGVSKQTENSESEINYIAFPDDPDIHPAVMSQRERIKLMKEQQSPAAGQRLA